MKLALLGATGGVGREVLSQAVAAGHLSRPWCGTRQSCPRTSTSYGKTSPLRTSRSSPPRCATSTR